MKRIVHIVYIVICVGTSWDKKEGEMHLFPKVLILGIKKMHFGLMWVVLIVFTTKQKKSVSFSAREVIEVG